MSAVKRKLDSISDQDPEGHDEADHRQSTEEDIPDSVPEVVESAVDDSSSSLPTQEAEKEVIMPSNRLDEIISDTAGSSSFNKDTEDSAPAAVRETTSRPAAKKGKIKNPSSVWMIFSNENRELIYKEFPAMNFTEVAKTLAERYRAISPETRERLEGLMRLDKERHALEIAAAKLVEGNADDDMPLSGLGSNKSTDLELPLGRVRKIVKLDSDVKNIGKEAIVAISKATELFIAYLGLRCANTASQRGVRTVRDQDIVHTIHTLETLDFLRLDFPQQARAPAEGREKKSHSRVSVDKQQPVSSNPISQFFGGAKPAAASSSSAPSSDTPAETAEAADTADATSSNEPNVELEPEERPSEGAEGVDPEDSGFEGAGHGEIAMTVDSA